MQLSPLIQNPPPMQQRGAQSAATDSSVSFETAFDMLSNSETEDEVRVATLVDENFELETIETADREDQVATDDRAGNDAEIVPSDDRPKPEMTLQSQPSTIRSSPSQNLNARTGTNSVSTAQLTLAWQMKAFAGPAARLDAASMPASNSPLADIATTPARDSARLSSEGTAARSTSLPAMSAYTLEASAPAAGPSGSVSPIGLNTNKLGTDASEFISKPDSADKNAPVPQTIDPDKHDRVQFASLSIQQAERQTRVDAMSPPKILTEQKTTLTAAAVLSEADPKDSDPSISLVNKTQSVPPQGSSVQSPTPGAQNIPTRPFETGLAFHPLSLLADPTSFEPDTGTITSESRAVGASSLSAHISATMNAPPFHATVARQVAEALKGGAGRSVELTLSPAELGRVRMSLSTTDAGVSLIIHADRPETLDLMRRNIAELDRAFTDMGYADVDFAFSGGDGAQDQREEAPPDHSDVDAINDASLSTQQNAQQDITMPLSPSSAMDIRI